MTRSDVAFLTPVMPAEGGNGLAMRAGLFLDGLARAGLVRVLVIPVFGVPGPRAWAERRAASIEVLPLAGGADRLSDAVARLATAWGRKTAFAVGARPTLCQAATMEATEAVTVFMEGADVVHVFRLYLAPYLDLVLNPGRSGKPRIMLDVDDRDQSTERLAGRPAEAEAFARLEAHYLPLVDQVITAAPADARDLGTEHHLDAVMAVPNAVRPPVAVDPGVSAFDLLFVGNLSYAPNIEGARWLAEKVLPLLGSVRVAIVGSNPDPAVWSLADGDPRITVAGDVASVAPWYAGAQVVVVPVFRGGGTHTKVIEAFAHHRPVVTTRLGAAGLPFGGAGGLAGGGLAGGGLAGGGLAGGVLAGGVLAGGGLAGGGLAGGFASDGVQRCGPLVVADDPAAFAAACRALLDSPSPSLAAQLAAEGAADVARTSTVAVVAPQIADLARHILSS